MLPRLLLIHAASCCGMRKNLHSFMFQQRAATDSEKDAADAAKLADLWLWGDRVTLAGGVQLTGIVEQIDFTRTIIRNDVDVPVSVPNKVRSLSRGLVSRHLFSMQVRPRRDVV